jgi:hypothetical protein
MFNYPDTGNTSTKNTHFGSKHNRYCLVEGGIVESLSDGFIGRQPPRVVECSDRPLRRRMAPAAPAMPSTISTRRMKFTALPPWG